MKVIKKITAIMLSIMMVLGMCSVVGAAEGTTPKGKITINSAISGQTYKIYKMLTLESHDNADGKNLYSYKPADDKWDAFFRTGAGAKYVDINTNGYVEWKAVAEETEETKNARAADLAQEALAYVSEKNLTATDWKDVTGSSTTVEFNGLELGYYLVDSSAGALCGLTTTDNEVTIQEKNGAPTVDKKIDIGTNNVENLVSENSANLGDKVIFKTTITVQSGADNYVLHDMMDSHLEFIQIEKINDDKGRSYAKDTDYTVEQNSKDGCTFELKFTENFYTTKADDTSEIFIYYLAKVKEDAPIKVAMKNNTWLTYGDKNTETKKAETQTYTFGIPVFKHTGTGEAKKALAGAEFKLYTDADCTEAKALKFTKNSEDKYRYDKTSGNATLTSLSTGMINIEGIKEGTYYLKETAAPKGYNLLKDAIKIDIDADGNIKMGEITVEKVEVQNNAGSILPSTGGMGTALFYIFGAILVVGSGVVLITKKRMK